MIDAQLSMMPFVGQLLLVLDNVLWTQNHCVFCSVSPTTERTRKYSVQDSHETCCAGAARDTNNVIIKVPLLEVLDGVELFLAIAHASAYVKQSRNCLDDMLELYQSKHTVFRTRYTLRRKLSH